MNVDIKFRNDTQKAFYWHKERNGEYDGAFGNGKSYVGCERAFTHLATFGNYGMAIARQKYKVLRATTMKTFFKICPDQFIYRHNEQEGITVLKNKSFIYWMHLDDVDEQDVRGLEINSCLIDQAEEIGEGIYLVMDARIGRWEKATVPLFLLEQKLSEANREILAKISRDAQNQDSKVRVKLVNSFIKENTEWPRHEKWGHFLVPNYMDVLCNLDAEDDDSHWTYRFYNPESLERQNKHFYVTRETDKDLIDADTYARMLTRDSEWVDKYVKGIRGKSSSKIHILNKMSIIIQDEYPDDVFEQFLEKFIRKASLARILDHADTGITACGWAGSLNQIHVFYREYYEENTLISDNRQNIFDLTGDELIDDDYADPEIFTKDRQRVGGMQQGFWSVADEYADTEYTEAPPIYWLPADNNELATRNRINELLKLSLKYAHPITRESPAPGIYFIQKTKKFPNGCFHIINQIPRQRKKLISELNGKKIYSTARDDKVVDHGYDLVRYYVSQHNPDRPSTNKPPPKNSFANYNRISALRKNQVAPMSES